MARRRSAGARFTIGGFKREFTALLVDQASRKPACPAAEMIETGILVEIAHAPFDS